MSWLSRVKDAAISIVAGKAPDKPIVNNPTTPVEKLLNAAAPVVLAGVAAIVPAGASQAAVSTISDVSAVVNAVANPSAAVSAAQGQVSGLITTVGIGAHAAVDTFLTQHIGTQNTAMVDAGAEALAAAAIGALSASSSKSADEVASALHDFLNGFLGTAAASSAS